MPGIGIVMIAMMLLAYAALCLVFFLIVLIGFWGKKTWIKLLGGVPFALLMLLAAVSVGFGSIEYFRSKTPEGTFHRSFGFGVGDETTLHDGSYNVMFDWGHAEVVFTGNAKTISRIVDDGIHPISEQEFIDQCPNDFWNRIASSNLISSELACYEKSHFRDFQTIATALIVVNTNSGLTFFTWQGID